MSLANTRRTSRADRRRAVLAFVCAAALFVRCLIPVIPAYFFADSSYIELLRTLRRQYTVADFGICRDIANVRFDRAMQEIEENRDTIEKAAKTFNLPPEVIAAVILKEQFTRSAPDFLVVALAPLRGGRGSTGLGAVTARTARRAYSYFGCEDRIPRSSREILRRFMLDDGEAIYATACVLAYESAKLSSLGAGTSRDAASGKWFRVYTCYNGDSEYACKTIEYLPELSELF